MSQSDEGTQSGETSNSGTKYDEFTVSGSDLLSRVKELVHEGNVRRVYLKNGDGRTLLEIPLTAGVGVTAVAAVVSPILVAVGAIAAMLSNVTVGVERVVADDRGASDAAPGPTGDAPDPELSERRPGEVAPPPEHDPPRAE